MRLTAIVAVLTGLLALTATTASAKPRTLKEQYSAYYYAVAKKHGKRAPGRNIRRYGVRRKHGKGTRPATNHELAVSLRQLRVILHPPPPPPPAAPAVLASQVTSGVATSAAQSSAPAASGGCYSGFHGKWQFECGTWHGLGYSGDPVNYPESVQREAAAKLRAQRGGQPWPNCHGSLDAIAQCESGGSPTAKSR
jgi:hypothetical protein